MQAPSDDYVAELLKRDASRADSSRYVASGLGSLLSRNSDIKPRRRDGLKPNTRFLRNIVREADSHNAALRAKEEDESRSRLRRLKDDHPYERRHSQSRKVRDESDAREKTSSRHVARSGDKRPQRDRSRSPSRRHSRPRTVRERSRSEVRGQNRQYENQKPVKDKEAEKADVSDSDPSETLLGPRPPSTNSARGRGALKTSGIDSRFNDPAYDPRADVDLSADEYADDWDMAREALRDRMKWRNSRAERLRAAGFTEDEVGQMDAAGKEKDVFDVRWRKKGEQREWDRGKVLNKEGTVDVKPEWGRLKDT